MTQHIAFLGLGAMGARMAGRLLQAGHRVTVWNRSPAAAQGLLDAGATWADSPRTAATQADVVIAMVRDDEAARSVWCDPLTGALAGMQPGRIALDCSTLTPAWIQTWAQAVRAVGVRPVEAPVSGSRPAAESGQLVFLLGGDEADAEALKAILPSLGTVTHVGPMGHGALSKLSTNALLGLHVAALAELRGMLQRQGADVAQVMAAVARTPIWAPVDHYLLGSMVNGDFRPQFPVELIAKDFGYLLDTAGGPAQAPMAKAALQVFEQACAQGLGSDNMTGVAKLYS